MFKPPKKHIDAIQVEKNQQQALSIINGAMRSLYKLSIHAPSLMLAVCASIAAKEGMSKEGFVELASEIYDKQGGKTVKI